MPRIITRLLEYPAPTAEEMRNCSKKYSAQQWIELCRHPEFIEAFTNNIFQGQKIALDILSKNKK